MNNEESQHTIPYVPDEVKQQFTKDLLSGKTFERQDAETFKQLEEVAGGKHNCRGIRLSFIDDNKAEIGVVFALHLGKLSKKELKVLKKLDDLILRPPQQKPIKEN